jgi:uncharacterized protein (TIGR02452 family)
VCRNRAVVLPVYNPPGVALLSIAPENGQAQKKVPPALHYSSAILYSLHVPVFRNQEMELLSRPYMCSVLSSCCVNFNVGGMLNKNILTAEEDQYTLNIMQVRMFRVFQVATYHGVEMLILGPWGCGLNKNSPNEICSAIWGALLHPDMEGRFKEVIIAVPNDPNGKVYKTFSKNFKEVKVV